MKKFIAFILAATAILMTFTVPASALTDGDWEFTLLNNEVIITGYLGDGGKVVIPDTIFGCPVVKVDFDKQYDDDKIFNNVTSLTFPSTVKNITSDNYIDYDNVLTELILPEGVETIGEYSFEDAKIKSLVLPSTLKRIEGHAFYECINLESVTFPESMEYLGEWCFAYCNIKEVTVPVLKFCSDWIFFENKNLEKAVISEGNTAVYETMFRYCTSLKEVVIPSTVEEIHDSAFSECESLQSVILPAKLKTIGRSAFQGCSSLKEVVVPYGVTEIVLPAFSECDNLKSLYIPDTVTKITNEGTNMTLTHDSDNCIIYCTEGSTIAQYCQKAEISYLTDTSVNSGITVLYNGTRISFHSYGQNPELLNDRTLVPLRSIFEAMGATVEWDGNTSTAIAKRNGVEIKIQIGANEMYKDGKSIAVDVPAQLLNDRTMVPVRVIAEAFGANVVWNASGKTVLINE